MNLTAPPPSCRHHYYYYHYSTTSNVITNAIIIIIIMNIVIGPNWSSERPLWHRHWRREEMASGKQKKKEVGVTTKNHAMCQCAVVYFVISMVLVNVVIAWEPMNYSRHGGFCMKGRVVVRWSPPVPAHVDLIHTTSSLPPHNSLHFSRSSSHRLKWPVVVEVRPFREELPLRNWFWIQKSEDEEGWVGGGVFKIRSRYRWGAWFRARSLSHTHIHLSK